MKRVPKNKDSNLLALRDVDSPTVSNAIEAFRVRGLTEGYASMELSACYRELKSMVGYAVTCTADSTSAEPSGPNRLPDLLDAVAAAPKPSVVVIQHSGPSLKKSCFVGDVLCSCFQKLGAVGVVTDGGVRDLKGIQRRVKGFQVFAAGTVVSHGTATILDVGSTVSICGLTIHQGDLLHGDDNGLLVIPLEIADKVLEQVKLVQNKERRFLEFLNSGSFSLEEMKARLGH
jgi:4-hydroxy-4-methyl-2-oxoglutarate aldolase